MAALSQGQSGALRIGTFQSVGAKVLPEVMRRFLDAWPRVELTLTESPSDDELLRLVERGELDLAFTMLPSLEGPFETVELLRDPYVLVVPAGGELGGLERASLADLGDLTLIANRACRSTTLAEGELVQRGIGVDVAFRSDDNPTVQGLVGAGFGAALVPLRRSTAATTASACWSWSRRSRAAGSPSRGTATATAHPAARAFAELAAEVCAEVEASLDAAVPA